MKEEPKHENADDDVWKPFADLLGDLIQKYELALLEKMEKEKNQGTN